MSDVERRGARGRYREAVVDRRTRETPAWHAMRRPAPRRWRRLARWRRQRCRRRACRGRSRCTVHGTPLPTAVESTPPPGHSEWSPDLAPWRRCGRVARLRDDAAGEEGVGLLDAGVEDGHRPPSAGVPGGPRRGRVDEAALDSRSARRSMFSLDAGHAGRRRQRFQLRAVDARGEIRDGSRSCCRARRQRPRPGAIDVGERPGDRPSRCGRRHRHRQIAFGHERRRRRRR